MNNQNNTILDAITIVSFFIAIENLQENNTQTEMLKQKLDEQNDHYLKKSIELLEKSIVQNETIIRQNEELLRRKQ